MNQKEKILKRIKRKVHEIDSTARIVLYGSYARNDYTENSDIDILILLDKGKITYSDEQRIKYPLYDIEFETGLIISPIVLSKADWNAQHSKTPFYNNLKREGLEL